MQIPHLTTTRRRLALGGAALAILALAALFAAWPGAEPPATSPADAGWQPRIAWPAGERQVYRLRYRSRDEARPIVEQGGGATAAAEALESQLELEALVAVTREDAERGGESVRLRFEVLGCEQAAWQIAGGVAWTDAASCSAMLGGAVLGIETTTAGVTTALYDAPDADTAAQSVLQALWLRLQPALPPEPVEPGASYWVQERTLQGIAANVYRIDATEKADAGFALSRTTQALLDPRAARGLHERPQVDAAGAARFAFDAHGRLARGEGDERIAVRSADGVELLAAETSFAFEHLRSEPGGAPLDFAALAARAPDTARVGGDVRERLLDERIAGLDPPALLDGLRRPLAGGRQTDARFLWRASGYLEKHPEAAAQLLALYRSDASPELRGRVLDLLASVGHEQAQAAMRAALGDPHELVAGGVAARQLYQRLGLLEAPDLRTAEMVAAHYDTLAASGSLDAELTAAYSLGAIAGRLANGDGEAAALARSYNDRLAADVRGATDPGELAHRVSALGNARLEDNVPLLSDLAAHESALVRRHVAQALGKAGDGPPPDALLGLLGDPDSVVQRTAVRGAQPADAVYRQLAQDVAAGRVPQLNVRPILDLVKEGRSAHPATTAVLLDALLAQGIRDDKDRELALLLAR